MQWICFVFHHGEVISAYLPNGGTATLTQEHQLKLTEYLKSSFRAGKLKIIQCQGFKMILIKLCAGLPSGDHVPPGIGSLHWSLACIWSPFCTAHYPGSLCAMLEVWGFVLCVQMWGNLGNQQETMVQCSQNDICRPAHLAAKSAAV